MSASDRTQGSAASRDGASDKAHDEHRPTARQQVQQHDTGQIVRGAPLGEFPRAVEFQPEQAARERDEPGRRDKCEARYPTLIAAPAATGAPISTRSTMI
ncbi:hypothetical protein [Burkholderia gladioli]|uniref:hypothetical protein n=1 Tax=Burkholderia gladioli TaxID=28095 RepID=UPI00163F4175|nr:hypothetical protein [Burkholderia gladioli]